MQTRSNSLPLLAGVTTRLQKLMIILGLTGMAMIFVWSMYALATEPLGWPADALAEAQADWGDGRYWVKATFMESITLLIGGILGVPAAAGATIRAFISRDSTRAMPDGEKWRTVVASRSSRRVMIISGCVLLVVSGGAVLYSAFFDHTLLAPLRFVAPLLLLFAPMAVVAGVFIGLDAILPTRVVIGRVTNVRQAQSANGPACFITIGGTVVDVPLALFNRFSEHTFAAVEVSAFDRPRVVRLFEGQVV
jgi:hypothetical protein